MQPKSVKEVNERVKGFYEKAQQAARQRNFDYAIEMYNTALKHCPEFRDARLELRKVELDKIGNKISSTRQAWIATKSTMSLNVKGPSFIKKEDYNSAFEIAEGVLAKDPTVPGALKLLAKTAEEGGYEWLAIDTLEFYLKYHTKDLNVMRWLVELYLDNSRGEDAVNVCNKMRRIDPADGEVQSMLKNAMARSAMDKSSWMGDDKKDGTGAVEKEGEEAGNSTAPPKAKDATQQLIKKYETVLEDGNDTVDVRKKLARNYIKASLYDEAIEQLEACNGMGGQTDPGVQNMMFQAVDLRFEKAIKAWEDYGNKGDAEEKQAYQEIAKLEGQRSDYRLLRARERAVTYSNDPNIHMELAMILWERQEIDEALVEFQKAQGSPRHRKKATLHKGKCFAIKDQHDIAIKEFELLISEMPEMNKDKLDAIYELAASLKQLGRDDESMEQYKIIYQEDVSYRDVKELMDGFYQ
ncbi:MAG: hypothetical protein NE328_19560 [Lentisphaeraceae bacterium]|nr:hypothetical protein [Lentisphaeraceae bacterium]